MGGGGACVPPGAPDHSARLAHGDGPLASRYVIGEILHVHVDDELLDADGRPDDPRIPFVARMGKAWYAEVTPETMFEIPRPGNA